MSKFSVPAIIALLICSFTACEDDPAGPGPAVDDSLFYYCTDSAWKVVHNLEYAYDHRDLDLYLTCFTEDFEYWFIDYMLPVPEPVFWGLEMETLCHESLFTSSEIDSIRLALVGSSDVPWSGSSDSSVRELTRQFDLKVYIGTYGYLSTGTVVFVCSPGSSMEYSIGIWNDQSDFKYGREAITWPTIKTLFL